MSQNEDYILFLTKWYPNYEDPQLGVFVQKHAKLLSSRHRVVLIYLCPIWKDSKPKVEFQQKGNLEEYIVYYRSFKGLMKLFNPYMYYKFQKEVYLSLDGKVKHCFVNIGAKTGFLAYYHLRKKAIQYSLIEHWSGFVNGKFRAKSGYKKRFYKKLARNARSVFAVSDFLRSGMQKELNLKEIKIVPNLIEAKSSPEKSNEKRILVVGDLVDEIKNISGILQAFKSFSEVHPAYKLIVVGGGDSEAELKKLSSELKLDSKVDFKGRMGNSATQEEMIRCSFLVSNSNFETFGMVIAEALLAGKPVVSTKSGGPEEFLNEENSLLIDTNNQDQLLQAMMEMERRLDDFDAKKISRSIQEKYDRDKILNIFESEITSA